MGRAIIMCGSDGGLDPDELTASAADVLEGKKAGVQGSDEPVTGTMINRGAVSQALNAGGSYTIAKGYHNGSGKVSANDLASQTSGTATAAQILSGITAWVKGAKLTGSMANRGAVASSLNAGGSYTIPAGYHNGGGKITANSLSSQTSGNAAAGHILSGKTAWVNGSKVTGSISSLGGRTITPGSSQQTVSCSGRYMTGNIVVKGGDLFKMSSGEVTSSSSKLNYKRNDGYSDKFYYFTVSISGFRKIKLIAWVANSSFGGLASDSTFNLCGGSSFGGYYNLSSNSGSAHVNTTSIQLPAYAYKETVWYYIVGY